MKTKHLLLILIFAGLTIPANLFSQDLVFGFTNPAFGGNPYNYQWMLSSAQAQDTYKDVSESSLRDSYSRSPLKDFEESLNRQILSQLSRKLIESQFGESELSEGTYLIGNYQIEVGDDGGGLNIIISDLGTGDQTNVFIPFF